MLCTQYVSGDFTMMHCLHTYAHMSLSFKANTLDVTCNLKNDFVWSNSQCFTAIITGSEFFSIDWKTLLHVFFNCLIFKNWIKFLRAWKINGCLHTKNYTKIKNHVHKTLRGSHEKFPIRSQLQCKQCSIEWTVFIRKLNSERNLFAASQDDG